MCHLENHLTPVYWRKLDCRWDEVRYVWMGSPPSQTPIIQNIGHMYMCMHAFIPTLLARNMVSWWHLCCIDMFHCVSLCTCQKHVSVECPKHPETTLVSHAMWDRTETCFVRLFLWWNMSTMHGSILKHMTCFWCALKRSETCFTWHMHHLENYMFTGSNRIVWDMFPPSQTPSIQKTCCCTIWNLVYLHWKMQHARTMFLHSFLLASMRHVFVPANIQPGTCLVPHFEHRPILCFFMFMRQLWHVFGHLPENNFRGG